MQVGLGELIVWRLSGELKAPIGAANISKRFFRLFIFGRKTHLDRLNS